MTSIGPITVSVHDLTIRNFEFIITERSLNYLFIFLVQVNVVAFDDLLVGSHAETFKRPLLSVDACVSVGNFHA